MFHRNKEKLESFIENNSHFNGDVNTKGTLRIDGTMEGNVNADWVILGEKAFLKGNIAARGIIVGGKVEGNLKGKEIVEIKPKGTVSGDIAIRVLIPGNPGEPVFDQLTKHKVSTIMFYSNLTEHSIETFAFYEGNRCLTKNV